MSSHPSRQPIGIALIIVLIVIIVLGALAGGFGYSMRIETKLAQNASYETELEWLGRSGIDLARYILAQQMTIPNEGSYDALNQKWAGGPGGTNEALASISLENNRLGNGMFSVKIVDLERKFNINFADDTILRQAFVLMQIDASLFPSLVDAVMDWRDPDDAARLNGAESDYYLTLQPPYFCKDGPIDDVSELLMVRGVTAGMFYGSQGSVGSPRMFEFGSARTQRADEPPYAVGLRDLFSAVSGRMVNINTASAVVLQLVPGIDENLAQAIITTRAGPDGVDGTEDDTPFRSVGELVNVPGLNNTGAQQLSRVFSTRSFTFQINVQVRIDRYSREYVAVVRRLSPRDLPILHMYWK